MATRWRRWRVGLALWAAGATASTAWAQDADGDGLPDADEAAYGTDPGAVDSDGDSVPDGAEVLVYTSNPLGPLPICIPLGEVLVEDNVLNTAASMPADLDGDGDPDAVWVGHTDGVVGWSENPGDGVFSGTPASTTPLDSAFYLAIGDLDSDGDLDALVGTYAPDRVALVRNDAGVLQPAEILADLAIGGVGAVAVIDLDGDGDDDAVYADREAGAIVSFDNVAGVLQAPRLVVAVSGAHKVHGADLDGDGDVDLLVAHARGVDAFVGDGAGAFTRAGSVLLDPLGYTIDSLDTLDADADGDQDALVAIGYTSTVDLFDNLGAAQFAAAVRVTNLAGTPYATAGDLDGDGDEDVIVSAALSPGGGIRGDQVLWFENRAGAFGALQLLVDYNGLSHPTLPHAVDIDGDSDLDVLTTFQASDAVRWYVNPTVFPDEDGDGLSFLAERCLCDTDPADPDTDHGTLPDGDELLLLRDPLDPSDDVDLPIDTGTPPTGGGDDDDDDDGAGTATDDGGPDVLGDDGDGKDDAGGGCGCAGGGGGAGTGGSGPAGSLVALAAGLAAMRRRSRG